MLRAFVLVMMLAPPAAAQGFAGVGEPAFADARTAWLEGRDDPAALARLSALAGAGNVAAQVLLGAIVAEGLIPPQVAALPRAERIALTRAPGGLSGTSWLRVAAQADPAAARLELPMLRLAEVLPRTHAGDLQALLDQGEARAALRLIEVFANYGGTDESGGWTLIAHLGAHPGLQGHGLPVMDWLRALLTDPNSGVADAALAKDLTETVAQAPAADLALARVGAGVAGADAGAALLSPLAAPLAGVCTAACPTEAEACTLALVRAVAGRAGYLTLSPVESLIDSATYQASPRFAGDLRLRLAAGAAGIAADNACAGAVLAP